MQSHAQWTLADVELATVLFDQITSSPPLHVGPTKCGALLALAKCWAAAHPSDSCKQGEQRLVCGTG